MPNTNEQEPRQMDPRLARQVETAERRLSGNTVFDGSNALTRVAAAAGVFGESPRTTQRRRMSAAAPGGARRRRPQG